MADETPSLDPPAPDPGALPDFPALLRAQTLACGDFDTAMILGRCYGFVQWRNPQSLMQDDALEEALAARFHDQLSAGQDQRQGQSTPEPGLWLHVLSEAYDFGGHTRLLENILRHQAAGQISGGGTAHEVVATRALTPRFAGVCADLGVPARVVSPRPLEACRALVAAGLQADTIVLHLHPDDLISAIAARVLRRLGRQVLFLNHADHVFCFGVGAADCLLEVSGFGWTMTRARRGVRGQSFVGIPIDMPDASAPPHPDGPIVSVGSPTKYRPSGDGDFPGFAAQLLDQVSQDMVLIGPDGSEPWWAELRQRHPGRVHYLGLQSFEQMRGYLDTASCYIDSFPMTGGTAFSEALLAGKTVFGPPNLSSGYSLADALRAPDLDRLLADIVAFLCSGGIEPAGQERVRQRIATQFSQAAVCERVQRARAGERIPPPQELTPADIDLNRYFRGGPLDTTLPGARQIPLDLRLAAAGRILWGAGLRGMAAVPLKRLVLWISPVRRAALPLARGGG